MKEILKTAGVVVIVGVAYVATSALICVKAVQSLAKDGVSIFPGGNYENHKEE